MAGFAVCLIIALTAGFFIYKLGLERNLQSQIAPTPMAVINTQPTPTPKQDFDLIKYKIQVLNGSAIAGVAAKTKEALEKEGFNVVLVGNADRVDYEKTIIRLKKRIDKGYLDKLKSILKKLYVLGMDEELGDKEEVDVIVVIGKN